MPCEINFQWPHTQLEGDGVASTILTVNQSIQGREPKALTLGSGYFH